MKRQDADPENPRNPGPSRHRFFPLPSGAPDDPLAILRPPPSEVRGHLAWDQPASRARRAISLSADLGLAWVVTILTLRTWQLLPALDLRSAAIFAGAFALVWTLPKLVLARSPGEFVWQLRPVPRSSSLLSPWVRLRAPVYRFQSAGPSADAASTAITLALALTAAVMSWKLLATHPLWLAADARALVPYTAPAQAGAPAPGSDPEQAAARAEDWEELPFYYALGSWPRTFLGKPVFHLLPYEKGPPEHFPGKVIARWQLPDISVTFEGPKTPTALLALVDGQSALPAAEAARDLLRECIVAAGELKLASSPRCWSAREAALGRHIRELEARVHPRSWKLSWLTIGKPGAFPEVQAEGILLEGQGGARGQDRFLLITARGTHQAFILDYAPGPAGERARALFRAALRGLRASDDLLGSRAFANRTISDVDLGELAHAPDLATFLRGISDIQALLVSKITVDPKTFDTYFHLGGTSILLARRAAREPGELGDWKAVAKPMTESALRYARDILSAGGNGPAGEPAGLKDPRVQRLQDFWLEAAKY